MRILTVAFIFSTVFFLPGCRPPASTSAHAGADSKPTTVPTNAGEFSAISATHYFGRHWPKNFINAFRRSDVPADFQRIRDDGFNAVILLVSWGDFQSVFEPCCQYDERAFERLRFLLNEAKSAQLKVVLRVGFAWSFHPQAGDSHHRQHLLMNDPAVRQAYFAYIKRIAAELDGLEHVVLTFSTWEDLRLRHIEETAAADYLPRIFFGPGQA